MKKVVSVVLVLGLISILSFGCGGGGGGSTSGSGGGKTSLLAQDENALKTQDIVPAAAPKSIIHEDATLDFDSGSFAAGTTVEISTSQILAQPASGEFIGDAVCVDIGSASLDKPVTVTITYDEADIPGGASEDHITIVKFSETSGSLQELDDIDLDTTTNTVSGTTSSFSHIAVLFSAKGAWRIYTDSGSSFIIIIEPVELNENTVSGSWEYAGRNGAGGTVTLTKSSSTQYSATGTYDYRPAGYSDYGNWLGTFNLSNDTGTGTYTGYRTFFSTESGAFHCEFCGRADEVPDQAAAEAVVDAVMLALKNEDINTFMSYVSDTMEPHSNYGPPSEFPQYTDKASLGTFWSTLFNQFYFQDLEYASAYAEDKSSIVSASILGNLPTSDRPLRFVLTLTKEGDNWKVTSLN